MPVTLALPVPVARLLADTFDGAPVTHLAPTVGGFSNLTVTATIGGTRCVVKAADLPVKRADLRREAHVLALVSGRRLGAPTPLAFVEDDGWAVLVSRWRPGVPGLQLYGGPPTALVPAYTALGRTLARLHALPLPPPPEPGGADVLIATRARALATALPVLALPDQLCLALTQALAHPAWNPTAPRLVHGDAGLHNVLWGSRGLTLLDWEWAGWADPRLDLAWAAWTLRFRGLPRSLWEALLAGYGSARAATLDLDPATMGALAAGQVAAILARSAGRPAAWDEWLRRANWTIETLALL